MNQIILVRKFNSNNYERQSVRLHFNCKKQMNIFMYVSILISLKHFILSLNRVRINIISIAFSGKSTQVVCSQCTVITILLLYRIA